MRASFGPWAVLAAFLGGAVSVAATSDPQPPTLIRVPQTLEGAESGPMTSGHGMTLVGPAPVAQRKVAFANAKLLVGVAGYGTMELELTDYPADEFMYFLEGEVDITDARGVTHRIRAGDAIVVPKGFSGRWKQRGPVRKLAVMSLEPRAGAAQ